MTLFQVLGLSAVIFDGFSSASGDETETLAFKTLNQLPLIQTFLFWLTSCCWLVIILHRFERIQRRYHHCDVCIDAIHYY